MHLTPAPSASPLVAGASAAACAYGFRGEISMLSRRSFMWLTGAAAALPMVRVSAQRGGGGGAPAGPLPPAIAALTSMRDRAKPITADERKGRLERARRLMAEQKVDAIIL